MTLFMSVPNLQIDSISTLVNIFDKFQNNFPPKPSKIPSLILSILSLPNIFMPI